MGSHHTLVEWRQVFCWPFIFSPRTVGCCEVGSDLTPPALVWQWGQYYFLAVVSCLFLTFPSKPVPSGGGGAGSFWLCGLRPL